MAIRKKKTATNEEHAVGWYPGHMLKAKNKIKEKLNLVDIIIELIDARIPLTSLNPDFNDIFNSKPKLTILNKCSLAERKKTDLFLKQMSKNDIHAMELDSIKKINLKKLLPYIKRIVEKQRAKRKNMFFRKSIRCMIVGIPNVGKSTIINAITMRKRAITGSRPGVTKHQQWVKLDDDIELLDTPGILWPKIKTKDDELKLTLTGAIKDELIGHERIIDYLFELLDKQNYFTDNSDFEPQPQDHEDFLSLVAYKYGYILPGNKPDFFKASELVLKNFRDAKFGRFTLDSFE